jgi:2-oxo-4-hydroxy-4-carboxy-5-ureidoimidazoline decarboxylase
MPAERLARLPWHGDCLIAHSHAETSAEFAMPMTLAELNALDLDDFTASLGPVFERSPWVAAALWQHRPFAALDTMIAAMRAVLSDAGVEAQIALIRAHPDLAVKAADAKSLTRESAREQASAALDRLSAAEFQRFRDLNAAYREKFGFPFIICVRRHNKASILAEFERRLARDADTERDQALREIGDIAWLRFQDLVKAA